MGIFGYLTHNVSNAAFIFKPKQEAKGIPRSWIKHKGVEVLDYALFIQELKLRTMTPRMIIAPHFKCRRGIKNELPPKKMWKTIAPTLKILDKIAHENGLKVKEIVSAYRSPKYNRAVRGKSHSLHMYNNAIDVRFSNISPWKSAKVVRYYRDKKKFKGGIGTYSSFIHVDTRGENADW